METTTKEKPRVVIDHNELCGLITCSVDYSYQMGIGEMLAIENPIEADPYYEKTFEELFNGRNIAFRDIETGAIIMLMKEKLLKAAFQFALVYPQEFKRIGGSDGYLPNVGMRILLTALYGWKRVLSDIGEKYRKYL